MNKFLGEVTDAAFETDVLASGKPVLVDFWAEWCGPCRMLTPVVELLAEKYDGKAKIVKMNVDDNPQAPQRYGVRAIPTLILFKGGQEIERLLGAVSKSTIANVLDKHIEQVDAVAGD